MTVTTTTFAYDKSQRLTTQYSSAEAHYYSYNQRNMITQIQDVKTTSPDANRYFTYNGVGERVFGIDGTATPSYWTYDGSKMLMEQIGSSRVRWRHNNTRQPWLGSIVEHVDIDGGVAYPVMKGDGSIMQMKDVTNGISNNYETDSWGLVLGSSIAITGSPPTSRFQAVTPDLTSLVAASQQMRLVGSAGLLLAAQAFITNVAFAPLWQIADSPSGAVPEWIKRLIRPVAFGELKRATSGDPVTVTRKVDAWFKRWGWWFPPTLGPTPPKFATGNPEDWTQLSGSRPSHDWRTAKPDLGGLTWRFNNQPDCAHIRFIQSIQAFAVPLSGGDARPIAPFDLFGNETDPVAGGQSAEKLNHWRKTAQGFSMPDGSHIDKACDRVDDPDPFLHEEDDPDFANPDSAYGHDTPNIGDGSKVWDRFSQVTYRLETCAICVEGPDCHEDLLPSQPPVFYSCVTWESEQRKGKPPIVRETPGGLDEPSKHFMDTLQKWRDKHPSWTQCQKKK